MSGVGSGGCWRRAVDGVWRWGVRCKCLQKSNRSCTVEIAIGQPGQRNHVLVARQTHPCAQVSTTTPWTHDKLRYQRNWVALRDQVDMGDVGSLGHGAVNLQTQGNHVAVVCQHGQRQGHAFFFEFLALHIRAHHLFKGAQTGLRQAGDGEFVYLRFGRTQPKTPNAGSECGLKNSQDRLTTRKQARPHEGFFTK